MSSAPAGFLGREQLENGHPRYASVNIDKGTARIRSLTGADLLKVFRLLEKKEYLVDAVLVAFCLVDETGSPLYRQTDVETGTFDNWDARTLRQLGQACDEHIGFTEISYRWGDLEETAKN